MKVFKFFDLLVNLPKISIQEETLESPDLEFKEAVTAIADIRIVSAILSRWSLVVNDLS